MERELETTGPGPADDNARDAGRSVTYLSPDGAVGPTTAGADERTVPAAVEPMTATLMARLFGVPLLIISVIVGCAVLVVLLFGSITTDRERPIVSLLNILESQVGERTAGVLLPNEKEVWQAGRELALRLEDRDAELTADEVEAVAGRLSALLARFASDSAGLSEMGRQQMHFVMQALSKTRVPAAVEGIAAVLNDGDPTTRREALAVLASMHELAEARRVLPQVTRALGDSDPVVRTVACVAASAIADGSDRVVIEALAAAHTDSDREVRWNAALALARLGSDRGKSTLLDLLSRSYWEQDVKVQSRPTSGAVREYSMPPGAVERYLIAAIEAAGGLDDEEIRSEVLKLEDDPIPAVRDAARRVGAGRGEG